MPEPASDPRTHYGARLAFHRAQARAHARSDTRISILRAVVFVLGAFVWYLAVGPRALAPQWLVVPVLAFLGLLGLHERVLRRRRLAERGIALFERALERLEDRWAGQGQTGERLLDEGHLFAADLDILGRGSLFELLCRARTHDGEEMLARWLLSPSPHPVVRERQAAVAELREALPLREDWALLGDDARAVDTGSLVEWSRTPAAPASRTDRLIAAALATINLLVCCAWVLDGIGFGPLLLAFVVGAAWAYHLQSRRSAATAGLDRHARDLSVLALMLVRLERERFAAPRLAELRAALETSGLPASREVAHLLRLVELKDSSRNILFVPLARLVLWDTQIALALEAWRRRCGPRIAGWVATIAELEALCSLAGHAFERPGDPFPELIDAGPCFEGSGLGHPLLPTAVMVRNDVRLDASLRLLLVSGSNMSGKSTLLRTVGTNLALARAGAPVRAQRLRVSELTLGASLRTLDSLLAGHSRFYAEILRLRQIMQAATAGPLLFLLDEVLHGTNSDDRRRGAEAVVRGLLARGAIGLVTTHDLALARVADELAPEARNVHFEDHIDGDGRIAFDYRLKEGVVQRSNAVALMRAVGLEV